VSHPGVKILAAWLADGTNGVNACAAAVPRVGSDTAPPSLTIYNEWDHAWVRRGLAPEAADATASIAYPMLTVRRYSANWNGGLGKGYETGRMEIGTVQIACEIAQLNTDTADEARDEAYLLRGLRASLKLLDNAPQTSRDEASATVVLWPSTALQEVPMKPERGDKVSAVALVVTYPVWESTPATV
jgi:hypothetical protein